MTLMRDFCGYSRLYGMNTPKWIEEKRPLFAEILKQLSVQRVSSVASNMPNHTILDGTFRELESSGGSTELLFNILNLMEKHPTWKTNKPFAYHYDAMIAEAAMENNCTLITEDSDLYNEVNRLFPKKAIKYADFIKVAALHFNRNAT